jgi:UDP-N-acetylglucosamine--N-acetylmuramyl-(pentapeptide) pyrophosphoryl-undecaprenol N-acetylglucosamine transferase
LQFIHITGKNAEQTARLQTIYQNHELPHFIAPYHFDMATLWKAADLSICRSGASTIREMIAFEVPSILVPYPFASDNHQEKNAAFIAKKVGGAFMTLQHELTSHRLLHLLEKLFSHEMATYRAMQQALRSYKKRVEKQSFAEMVKQMMQS